jgi:hypothetical protein
LLLFHWQSALSDLLAFLITFLHLHCHPLWDFYTVMERVLKNVAKPSLSLSTQTLQ